MKKYNKALQKIKITAALICCVLATRNSYAGTNISEQQKIINDYINEVMIKGNKNYNPDNWSINVFQEITTVVDKSKIPQKVLAVSAFSNEYYTFVAYIKDNVLQNIVPLKGSEFFSGVGENNKDYVFKDIDIDGDSLNEILAITYTVGGQGTNFAYINIIKNTSIIFDLCLSEIRYQKMTTSSGDSLDVPISEADLFTIRYNQTTRELEIKTNIWSKTFIWNGKKVMLRKLQEK